MHNTIIDPTLSTKKQVDYTLTRLYSNDTILKGPSRRLQTCTKAKALKKNAGKSNAQIVYYGSKGSWQ